ncbi:MAG: hypothetical protein H0W16_06265 [Actinobacteria bacterium]|nr:hypothetical protein [Actinomycetota bacterium]
MKLVVLALAAWGLWIALRRGRPDPLRVVVAWADGSEVELASGPERERLVAVAERALP